MVDRSVPILEPRGTQGYGIGDERFDLGEQLIVRQRRAASALLGAPGRPLGDVRAGDADRLEASELVLMVVDFVPVISTCCPRYFWSFVLPVA